MTTSSTKAVPYPGSVFDSIARRIGRRLRDVYPDPESEPLPSNHVQMLLELHQKERSRAARRR